MSWDYKPITIKERLSTLENELDELINLQEVSREANTNSRCINYKNRTVQNCACTNVSTSRPTNDQRNNHLPCFLGKSATEPLCDISKFLQHINLNISKGTQAITKIVNLSTEQKNDGNNNNLYHENGLKKNNTLKPVSDNRTLFAKPNEDILFKEIREEKEKRLRAENQIKSLKEEIKNNRAELQQKADSMLLLQSELKQTLVKLEEAKNELQEYQDRQAFGCLWPFQFQALSKELEDERVQRAEAERKIQVLQDKLKNKFDCIEENRKVHATVNWLTNQNQHLTCLIEKLQSDNENKNIEILNKNQTVENSFKKMRQLISVCEKLRDQLVVMKQKTTDGEEKLKYNLIHCEKITETLLKEQAKSEELKRRQIRDRQEQQRLFQTIRTVTASNETLQGRLDEISEIVKQQKDLIDYQSEKLGFKEDQIKLAQENIKLHTEREKEFETKIKALYSEIKENRQLFVTNNINEIQLELESEQEKLLIKEKIIESQLQTTRKLKTTLAEKETEVHQLKIDISEKEQKLSIQQNTNDQLLSKIKALQCGKQELKNKIEELEEELEAQESSEQAKRLDLIENQVTEKQRKMEEHIALIKKEKQEVLEKLECTTRELESRTAELNKEIITQERNIKILNAQLSDKDQHLKEALEQICILSHELEEASERARKSENCYQEKLKTACEAWKKTMQLLQS